MKQILYTGLLLLLAAASDLMGQNNIIPNPDFEAGSPLCMLNPNASQFNNNVPHWKTNVDNAAFIHLDHCSPSPSCDYLGSKRFVWIKTWPAYLGFGAYNCNSRARQYVGVALPNGATFDPALTYVIRYKYVNTGGENLSGTGCDWTLTYNHLRVFASAWGPINWTSSNNPALEELFSANLQIDGRAETCNWKAVERVFQVSSSQLTTLILMASTGGFFLDDIEVFPLCGNNYLIQNKDYSLFVDTYDPLAVEGHDLLEQAGNYLTAGSNVGLNNGTGPVSIGTSNGANTKVRYSALQEITLKDGFNVMAGADFSAKIHGTCSASRRRMVGNGVGTYQELVAGDVATGSLRTSAAAPNVYPNPAQGMIKIDDYAPGSFVVIYDAAGRTVREFVISTPGSISVDLRDLSPGIYNLIIRSASQEILFAEKMVKE